MYAGSGRPAKYCTPHKKEAKRKQDRARPDNGHKRRYYYPCCIDARKAGVVTYGKATVKTEVEVYDPLANRMKVTVKVTVIQSAYVKRAAVKVCEQHKQAAALTDKKARKASARRAESDAERIDPGLVEVKLSESYRITMNDPDNYSTPEYGQFLGGSRYGRDVQLELAADAWIARKNPQ
jgi:hypothetical protein